ncbi:MAG: DinB family protein [Nocardioides sp.]
MTINRTEPPLAADEVTTLRSFLDYYRDTIRLKVAGLDRSQLAHTLAPSSMTLGGLLKHCAFVESYWFVEIFAGAGTPEPFASADWEADEDWEWHTAQHDSPAELLALFDRSVAESNRIVDEAVVTGSLDSPSAITSKRQHVPFSLRWILVHLIEEYARHAGHADLIRESIDGQVGD